VTELVASREEIRIAVCHQAVWLADTHELAALDGKLSGFGFCMPAAYHSLEAGDPAQLSYVQSKTLQPP